MKTGILCTILFCTAAGGFVAWRVHAVKTQSTPHFAIVEDRSMSHPDGCKSLLGLVEQALSTEGATASSMLSVLVLGDQSTAYQPRVLGRYSIPRTRKVLEGRAADRRRQQEILRDIENRCQTSQGTKTSPIFLGVKQAIADLRARGCSENSNCKLFVDSDLEENVEMSIKKSINDKGAVMRSLQLAVNNEGIDVTFCGLAVTAGRILDPSGRETRLATSGSSDRGDQLMQIWSTLYTRRETIRFRPYCPQSTH